MLNGITGAAPVCCATPEARQAGVILGDTGRPVGVVVSSGGAPGARTPRGLLETIGAAIDNAVHGGDSGYAQGGSAGGGGYAGPNPIPFPMVNPFKPVVQTGSPVTGLTAFPDRFTYSIESEGSEPDDEQSSLNGLSGMGDLGYSWSDFGQHWAGGPLTTVSSGPSKLQSILGAIQGTLPATIQAFRAAPNNIYPSTYNPYTSAAGGAYPSEYGGGQPQAGANIGAQAGAAVGNIGDTFGNIVAQHPYLVLGGIAAAVLLFMNPPRRR